MSTPVAFSVYSAKSRKEIPKRKSPKYRCLPVWISRMPIRKAGQKTMARLKEKPADMIQAESVVPMLAPMMTEMACARVRRAALTKDTVITVVAAEDWTETVTNIPVSTPVKRLPVMAPRT